jgi:insertion element IS1 protein InsB
MYCNGRCPKAGKQANGTQKYQCKLCRRYQQAEYVRKAWQPETNTRVIAHLKEGCGIWNKSRGIRRFPRLMKIAKGTVAARIKAIAAKIVPPRIESRGLDYEVDELHTFIGTSKRNAM